MKRQVRTRHWVILGVWFVAYTIALEFFRFRFGLNEIAGVFLFAGILLMILADRLIERRQR